MTPYPVVSSASSVDHRSCAGRWKGGPLLCGHGSCFSMGWGGGGGPVMAPSERLLYQPPAARQWSLPRRTHPRPGHSHHAFHMIRLPPWLLHWPNATVQPGNRRPPAPHRFHRNPVSSTLPRQLLLPQWSCPCNCFSLPISSGSFLSPRQEGGLAGWRVGAGGCDRVGRCFTSNLPSTNHLII